MKFKKDLKFKPYFYFLRTQRRRSRRFSPLFAVFLFLSGFFIAVVSLEQAFGFSLLSVSHKIFTPNGDNQNDRVVFEFENDADELLSGKIYDVTGAFVADMTVQDEDTLFWQGRDRTGRVVPAGIYFYQIEAQGQKTSGAIIVAR